MTLKITLNLFVLLLLGQAAELWLGGAWIFPLLSGALMGTAIAEFENEQAKQKAKVKK